MIMKSTAFRALLHTRTRTGAAHLRSRARNGSWDPCQRIHTSCSMHSSHYEVLGVREDATIDDIKRAFRQHAKRLHPDARGAGVTQDSHAADGERGGKHARSNRRTGASAAAAGGMDMDTEAFVAVVLAYEVLSDPTKRRAYDSTRTPAWSSSHARPHAQGWHAGMTQHAESSTEEENAQHAVIREDEEEDTSRDDPSRPFGGYAGIARRAQKYGTGTVWSALEFAHSGPRYEGSMNDYPYAFECDERNDALASRDLLQMVVGRSLIGSVRGRGMEMLAGGERAGTQPEQYLGDGGPRAAEAVPRDTDAHPRDSARAAFTPPDAGPKLVQGAYDSLEFRYHGKLLASAMMFGDGGGIYDVAEAWRDFHGDGTAAPDLPQETSNYYTIYRHYQDGSRGPPIAHVLGAHGVGVMHFRRIIACDLVGAPPPPASTPAEKREVDVPRVSPDSPDVHARVNSDFSNGVWRRHAQRATSTAQSQTAGGSPRGAIPRPPARQRWNQSLPWIAVGDGPVIPTFSAHHSRFPSVRRTPPNSAQGDAFDIGWQFDAAGEVQRQNQATATTCSSSDQFYACPQTGHPVPHDPALVDASCATHTFVAYRTLGVTHLRWLRHFDGAVECSASRVRVPPSEFWLWEPRSRAHERSGYYFEVARRRAVEPALHPAVYVLTSAVVTLEAEWRAAVQASQSSLWRSTASALTDTLASMFKSTGTKG